MSVVVVETPCRGGDEMRCFPGGRKLRKKRLVKKFLKWFTFICDQQALRAKAS